MIIFINYQLNYLGAYMTSEKKEKDFCDAKDQKKVIDKMTECDENSKNGKETEECYKKIVDEDDGCMS